MKEQVTKAVIPAAGFGTRMLPFTKAVPKELIPLVDTPVLQYVVEEAVSAGAQDILVIISKGKEAIINHFSPGEELEEKLLALHKNQLADRIKKINNLARIRYVYQHELNGLGDAVALARDFCSNEPFMVLLGDTVMDSASNVSVTGQLCEVFRRYHSSVIAVEKVSREKISSYGIVGGRELSAGVLKIDTLVEKPAPENAPGDMAVASRYLFTPGIFDALSVTAPGLHGEIQLTDSIVNLMKKESVYGCQIKGRRFDLGTVTGFVAANVEFALRRPELQDTLGRQIVRILKEKNIFEM